MQCQDLQSSHQRSPPMDDEKKDDEKIVVWGNRTLSASEEHSVRKISSRFFYEHIKKVITERYHSGSNREEVVEEVRNMLSQFIPKNDFDIKVNEDPELVSQRRFEAHVEITHKAQPYIDEFERLFQSDDFKNCIKKK